MPPGRHRRILIVVAADPAGMGGKSLRFAGGGGHQRQILTGRRVQMSRVPLAGSQVGAILLVKPFSPLMPQGIRLRVGKAVSADAAECSVLPSSVQLGGVTVSAYTQPPVSSWLLSRWQTRAWLPS